jgi:hypothetical protein
MDSATPTLRTQARAAKMNILAMRQSFTDSLTSTLQTGADNLTIADMNTEGANMLMLKTRQSMRGSSLKGSALSSACSEQSRKDGRVSVQWLTASLIWRRQGEIP